MNEKLKIKEFIQMLKKRFLVIILTTICITGVIIIASMYLMKPTYEYSIQVLVGSLGVEKDDKPVNRVDENRQLATSFMDVIQSPHIMLGVKKKLNLDESSYELLKQVSVTNRDNSQIITISVKNSNSQLTKDIAQSIAKQSIFKFKDYANINQLNILNDSVSTQKAKLLFPKPKFIIVISIVVGFFVGIGLVLLREYLDDKTYSEQEMEQLGIPLLGRVKLNAKRKEKKRKTPYKPLSLEKLGGDIDN